MRAILNKVIFRWFWCWWISTCRGFDRVVDGAGAADAAHGQGGGLAAFVEGVDGGRVNDVKRGHAGRDGDQAGHGVVSHAVGEGRRGGGEVGAGGGGVARQHERQGHRLRGRSGQGDGLGKVAAFGGAARPDRADGGVGGVVDGAGAADAAHGQGGGLAAFVEGVDGGRVNDVKRGHAGRDGDQAGHGVVSHAVGEGRRGGGEVGAGGGGVARQHERQGHRLRGRSGQGDGLGKVAAFGGAARPDRADGGVGGVVDGAGAADAAHGQGGGLAAFVEGVDGGRVNDVKRGHAGRDGDQAGHGVVSHAVGEGRRGGGEVGAGGGGVARQHERQGHRLRGRSGQGDGLGKVAAFGGAARPDRADGGVGGVVDGAGAADAAHGQGGGLAAFVEGVDGGRVNDVKRGHAGRDGDQAGHGVVSHAVGEGRRGGGEVGAGGGGVARQHERQGHRLRGRSGQGDGLGKVAAFGGAARPDRADGGVGGVVDGAGAADAAHGQGGGLAAFVEGVDGGRVNDVKRGHAGRDGDQAGHGVVSHAVGEGRRGGGEVGAGGGGVARQHERQGHRLRGRSGQGDGLGKVAAFGGAARPDRADGGVGGVVDGAGAADAAHGQGGGLAAFVEGVDGGRVNDVKRGHAGRDGDQAGHGVVSHAVGEGRRGGGEVGAGGGGVARQHERQGHRLRGRSGQGDGLGKVAAFGGAARPDRADGGVGGVVDGAGAADAAHGQGGGLAAFVEGVDGGRVNDVKRGHAGRDGDQAGHGVVSHAVGEGRRGGGEVGAGGGGVARQHERQGHRLRGRSGQGDGLGKVAAFGGAARPDRADGGVGGVVDGAGAADAAHGQGGGLAAFVEGVDGGRVNDVKRGHAGRDGDQAGHGVVSHAVGEGRRGGGEVGAGGGGVARQHERQGHRLRGRSGQGDGLGKVAAFGGAARPDRADGGVGGVVDGAGAADAAHGQGGGLAAFVEGVDGGRVNDVKRGHAGRDGDQAGHGVVSHAVGEGRRGGGEVGAGGGGVARQHERQGHRLRGRSGQGDGLGKVAAFGGAARPDRADGGVGGVVDGAGAADAAHGQGGGLAAFVEGVDGGRVNDVKRGHAGRDGDQAGHGVVSHAVGEGRRGGGEVGAGGGGVARQHERQGHRLRGRSGQGDGLGKVAAFGGAARPDRADGGVGGVVDGAGAADAAHGQGGGLAAFVEGVDGGRVNDVKRGHAGRDGDQAGHGVVSHAVGEGRRGGGEVGAGGGGVARQHERQGHRLRGRSGQGDGLGKVAAFGGAARPDRADGGVGGVVDGAGAADAAHGQGGGLAAFVEGVDGGRVNDVKRGHAGRDGDQAGHGVVSHAVGEGRRGGGEVGAGGGGVARQHERQGHRLRGRSGQGDGLGKVAAFGGAARPDRADGGVGGVVDGAGAADAAHGQGGGLAAFVEGVDGGRVNDVKRGHAGRDGDQAGHGVVSHAVGEGRRGGGEVGAGGGGVARQHERQGHRLRGRSGQGDGLGKVAAFGGAARPDRADGGVGGVVDGAGAADAAHGQGGGLAAFVEGVDGGRVNDVKRGHAGRDGDQAGHGVVSHAVGEGRRGGGEVGAGGGGVARQHERQGHRLRGRSGQGDGLGKVAAFGGAARPDRADGGVGGVVDGAGAADAAHGQGGGLAAFVEGVDGGRVNDVKRGHAGRDGDQAGHGVVSHAVGEGRRGGGEVGAGGGGVARQHERQGHRLRGRSGQGDGLGKVAAFGGAARPDRADGGVGGVVDGAGAADAAHGQGGGLAAFVEGVDGGRVNDVKRGHAGRDGDQAGHGVVSHAVGEGRRGGGEVGAGGGGVARQHERQGHRLRGRSGQGDGLGKVAAFGGAARPDRADGGVGGVVDGAGAADAAHGQGGGLAAFVEGVDGGRVNDVKRGHAGRDGDQAGHGVVSHAVGEGRRGGGEVGVARQHERQGHRLRWSG